MNENNYKLLTTPTIECLRYKYKKQETYLYQRRSQLQCHLVDHPPKYLDTMHHWPVLKYHMFLVHSFESPQNTLYHQHVPKKETSYIKAKVTTH